MLRKKAPVPEPEEELGVIGRKWLLCPFIQQHQLDEVIRSCDYCGQYLSLCCVHPHSEHDERHVCHHRPLVFTDGACLNNGKEDARAGCGVVVGTAKGQKYSLPFEDEHVSSQRAELYAAYEGIVRGMKHFREREIHPKRGATDKRTELVIATDSDYVVMGMTEWLPKWKVRGFKNSSGKTPSNLDLFLKIDEKIKEFEEPDDVVIGFWHVPRKHNVVADRLAKLAANREDASDDLVDDRPVFDANAPYYGVGDDFVNILLEVYRGMRAEHPELTKTAVLRAALELDDQTRGRSFTNGEYKDVVVAQLATTGRYDVPDVQERLY